MKTIYTVDSYAKINLGLHVTGKLESGFHAIETGFVYIDWRDRIRITPANRTTLRVSGNEQVPANEENLILQTIPFLRSRGLKGEYAISLEKYIPVGAGLGGGSSNAASVLRALNEIENLHLSTEELDEIGGALGSDIPFFLYNETAIGTGRGTDLEFIDIQPDAWILTVFPNIHSSTAEAYQYCQPNVDREDSLKDTLLNFDMDEWEIFLENDLETAVFPIYPLVGNIKDEMKQWGALYAAMSGSGSSVFGLFTQDFVAQDAMNSFIQLGYPVKLTPPSFVPDTKVYKLEE